MAIDFEKYITSCKTEYNLAITNTYLFGIKVPSQLQFLPSYLKIISLQIFSFH